MWLRQSRFAELYVLAILTLLAVGSNFVDYALANPYTYTGEVPPDSETFPPVITISSPVNNSVYNTNVVPLNFDVAAPQSRTASSTNVQGVTYEVDWKKEPVNVLNGGQEHPYFNLQFSFVPEGHHTIVIKAVGSGLYKETELSYKWFFIRSSTTISFTVDHTAPTVSVLSPQNISSESPIPLNVTVNEAYSKIAYSLNGQQNVTVAGNSTIPNLSSGQYNVTFYVWDLAGNLGTSETADFSVAEIPQTEQTTADSPILMVTAAFLTIALIAVALLVKKYHRGSDKLKCAVQGSSVS